MGAIGGRVFFDSLKTPISSQLEEVIGRCTLIKRGIAEADPTDFGIRRLLNFGHTVGHAIESLSGYAVTHGHAVAAGMAIMTRAAVGMGICQTDCRDDILGMLEAYDLPMTTEYTAEALSQACLGDKKRDGDAIALVLPEETGKCAIRTTPITELAGLIRLGLS